MPIRDSRESWNEYQRSWLRQRRLERRIMLIELLGGKCEWCGSRQKADLEFDHIYPQHKKFKISGNEHFALDRLLDEVKKCRLLCSDCHVPRTTKQASDRARRIAAS